MIRTVSVCFYKHLPRRFCTMIKTQNAEFKKRVSLIQNLSSEYDDISVIIPVINKNKKLSQIHFNDWKDRIELLKSFSFTAGDCLKMISQYPNLLEIPLTDVEDSIRTWSTCPFDFTTFKNLLITVPECLDVDSDEIKYRLPRIFSFFKSPKSAVTLIINSPNILFDDWHSILEIFEYLTKVRGIEKKDILQSRALSKPLDFIKLRFYILEKTGIYKIPIMHAHKKSKYMPLKHKNPHLRFVTDYRVKEFSEKIAKISVEEYYVCKELFEEEEGDVNLEDEEDSDNE